MLAEIKNQLSSVFQDVEISLQQEGNQVDVQLFRNQEPVSRFLLYEGAECIGMKLDKVSAFQEVFFYEQCFNRVLDLLVHVGKSHHKKTFQFLNTPLSRISNWSTWVNPILKKHAFVDCWRIISANYELLDYMKLTALSSDSFCIKELIPHTIPALFEANKLVVCLQTIQSSHPTFYSWKVIGKDYIRFYYSGYQGELVPIFDQEKGLILMVNQDFSFSVPLNTLLEDVSSFLPLLKQIEKRKRLENIYNPPMFHINRHLYDLIGDNYQRVKDVFGYLTSLYEAEDIEEFFALSFSSYPRIGQSNDDLFVFFIIDAYFLLDFRVETSFYVANDLQTIQQEYTRRVFSPFIERDMTNKAEF